MTRTQYPRAPQSKAPIPRPAGIVGRFAGAVGKAIRLLFVSFLMSVLIEWVGMHLWWTEMGSDHSRQMVEVEARFLGENLSSSWARSRALLAIGMQLAELVDTIKESNALAPAARWWQRARARVSSSADWRRLKRAASPYVSAALNVLALYRIRLTVLFLAAPLFLMLILVGLVDGLVQRDLRRWGGGRESAYVYHYAKRSNVFFLGLGAVVYLASPVSLHPSLVLLPFAIACAITVAVTASRFKKYL